MMNTTTKEAVIIGDLLEKVMKRLQEQPFSEKNEQQREDTPIFKIGMNTTPNFPHAA